MPAQLTTPNSLLQMLPAGLLGLDLSDPSNAMLGQILTNWLKQSIIQPLTGISPTDPLWGATLYTNMTDFGAMMSNMNAAANSRGLSNMMQIQASARYQFLEGWQRTATTRDMFDSMTPEQRGGFSNYDAFIQHKTQGMMDNAVLTLLMQNGMWDPTGKMLASGYVRQASANAAREAMWRGDKNFMDQADAIAKVFMDDQYKLDYNKRDYGLMTMNESAAVLAAMTKNKGLFDFSPETQREVQSIRSQLDSGKLSIPEGNRQMETQMRNATQALRDQLKGLTSAMAPLKDFFGDDVPSMIRFLEELSGRAFSELDTSAVKDLSRRVSNSMSTGLYTAEQLSAVSKTLNQSLSQIDTPFYLEPAAGAISHTLLTTANAGITPALMTDSAFKNAVGERAIRHAASPFANNVNLSYANWRYNIEEADRRYNKTLQEGEEKRVSDVSFEAFQARYNELIKTYTPENALLQLANASSFMQMAKNGYGLSGYEIAAKNGLGSRLTDAEALRTRILQVASTRDTVDETRAVMDVYRMFTEDTEERRGQTTQAIVDRLKGMETSDNEYERLLSRTYRTMSTRKDWMNVHMDLLAQSAQVDANVRTVNAEQVRRRTEFVSDLFGDVGTNAANINELIFNTLLGDRGSGMKLEDTVAKLKGKTQLTELADRAGLNDKDIQNIQTMLQVNQALLGDKESAADEEKMYRMSLESAQKYMMDKITSPRRAALLEPYVQEAKTALGRTGDAWKDENKRVFDLFQRVSSMSTESLELFAAEDEALGRNKGDSLTSFIRDTDERYKSVQAARKQIIEYTSVNRIDALITALQGGEIKVKDMAGLDVNIMDEVMPGWSKELASAQQAALAGDTSQLDDLKNRVGSRLFAYINQTDTDYFFSEARSKGAFQKFNYGKDRVRYQDMEGKAIGILQGTMGDRYYGTVSAEGQTPQAAGQLAHSDFIKSVMTDKTKDIDKWLNDHFAGYSEEERKSIRQAYDTLLNEVKASGPVTAESIGNLSVEDLMKKALGDGEIFRELDKGIRGLTDLLTQIPAFIKGAAETWNIDLAKYERK